MIQLHYVRARKHAFPYAEAKVAGPFEARAEAWDAKDRLTPLYPEAELAVATRHVNNKTGALKLGGPKIIERTNNGN